MRLPASLILASSALSSFLASARNRKSETTAATARARPPQYHFFRIASSFETLSTGLHPFEGNPKLEIRNPKQIRITKSQIRNQDKRDRGLGYWDFGHWDLFWISSFGFLFKAYPLLEQTQTLVGT